MPHFTLPLAGNVAYEADDKAIARLFEPCGVIKVRRMWGAVKNAQQPAVAWCRQLRLPSNGSSLGAPCLTCALLLCTCPAGAAAHRQGHGAAQGLRARALQVGDLLGWGRSPGLAHDLTSHEVWPTSACKAAMLHRCAAHASRPQSGRAPAPASGWVTRSPVGRASRCGTRPERPATWALGTHDPSTSLHVFSQLLSRTFVSSTASHSDNVPDIAEPSLMNPSPHPVRHVATLTSPGAQLLHRLRQDRPRPEQGLEGVAGGGAGDGGALVCRPARGEARGRAAWGSARGAVRREAQGLGRPLCLGRGSGCALTFPDQLPVQVWLSPPTCCPTAPAAGQEVAEGAAREGHHPGLRVHHPGPPAPAARRQDRQQGGAGARAASRHQHTHPGQRGRHCHRRHAAHRC